MSLIILYFLYDIVSSWWTDLFIITELSLLLKIFFALKSNLWNGKVDIFKKGFFWIFKRLIAIKLISIKEYTVLGHGDARV